MDCAKLPFSGLGFKLCLRAREGEKFNGSPHAMIRSFLQSTCRGFQTFDDGLFT
jgi:hypothetical protein